MEATTIPKEIMSINYLSPYEGTAFDCNGDLNGTAYTDACGTCAAGNTGKTPNSSCIPLKKWNNITDPNVDNLPVTTTPQEFITVYNLSKSVSGN